MTETEPLSTGEIARFSALPTSSLSDSLDRLGLHGAIEGLSPTNAAARIAGRAITLAYLPVGVSGGTVGDYIDDVAPGDVIVIDNRGRTDCTVWGNILSEVAQKRGVAGTIIDGVNRDVNEILDIGYPIWSRRAHMRTGKDRVALVAVNTPVCIGTVLVEPGDIICADGSGVVAVPQSRARDVLALAEEIEAHETAILSDTRDGRPLGEARARHGYYTLQSRPEKEN